MNFPPPNPNDRLCHPFCKYPPCDQKEMNPQEFTQWCETHGIGPLPTDSPNE